MARLDLTNQRFGKLIALEPGPNQGRRTTWKCLCDCGNETTVRTENLRSGHTTSCGCAVHQPSKRFIDLTGQHFGEWTVLSKAERDSYWKCRCSCGKEKEVYASSLKNGKSLSCGHLFKNNIRNPIIGNRYGNLVVLSQYKENDNWYCECQCDCGNKSIVKRQNLISGNTQSCGCIQSKGEASIKRILQQNNIPFIWQWIPNDYPNQKCKFDFYVNNERVIEFDGPQHKGQIGGYYTKEKVDALIQRDKEKNKYCFERNIPIVRIPYYERDNITLDMILGDKYLLTPDMEEEQEI